MCFKWTNSKYGITFPYNLNVAWVLTEPNTVLTLKALKQGKQDFIGCYRVKDK